MSCKDCKWFDDNVHIKDTGYCKCFGEFVKANEDWCEEFEEE